jgi:choline dehydrogenase-like flavoprotein
MDGACPNSSTGATQLNRTRVARSRTYEGASFSAAPRGLRGLRCGARWPTTRGGQRSAIQAGGSRTCSHTSRGSRPTSISAITLGTDHGPLPITRYLDLELTEVAAAGLQALEAAGLTVVEDHNRPGAVGAGRMPMSSRAGARVTTADAYLPVGRTPPNLTIRPDTHVADVVFDRMRAVGVRLLNGTIIQAGWVVLCAGTYGSPVLLMRSGIGPAEHLRSLAIPVRLDLPGVGANLADHAGIDIDAGYRGPARPAPILHLIATFHSSAAARDQART